MSIWAVVGVQACALPVAGGRVRFQFNRSLPAVAFQNPKLVIDEIEKDLESVSSVRNRRSGQTAGRDVKRDVPGMVGPRRESMSSFAANLRQLVEGCAGFLSISINMII